MYPYHNPYAFNPAFNPQPAQMPLTSAQQNGGVNWVQGEAGAKAWLVAPGQTIFLMDSEGSTFYMKSADQSGMPTLRVFDFQERAQTPPAPPEPPAVWEQLTHRIDALEKRLDGMEVGTNG